MRFLLAYEQVPEGFTKLSASDANGKTSPGSDRKEPQGEEMKRNLFGILAILTLSIWIGVPSMSAQTIAKATVPFAFTVGQTEMPAGNYIINSVADSAIVITNRNKQRYQCVPF